MKKSFLAAGILVLLFAVYRHWLGLSSLSAGDWSFHFPDEIVHFFVWPCAWAFGFHGGLGGNGVFLAGLETYFLATAKLFYTLTGAGWAWSERVIWYIPFLLVGTYASIFLVRTVFPKCWFWWLAPMIFLTNTYILLITGGGQMGIAMAYAVAPLVLTHFVRLVNNPMFRRAIVTGLVLALIILFDPRIAYIVLLGVLFYWVIAMIVEKTVSIRNVFFLGISLLIAVLIHAFWILPLLWFRVNPIASFGEAYSSIASVKFFSFADFSHALSLLHPNWPENLFGKVYFLQPEFLILPILAFSSLLFVSQKSDNRRPASPAGRPVTFFALLAIMGVFLSKGANDPGGGIYLWLFDHVLGFNVFRDPTKFYLLTALAYSILIPVALDRMGKKKAFLGIVFVLFWLVTIRQAVLGQLGGTFTTHTVPSEYEVLKNVLNQPEYFRTFWVPHSERYGLSTYTHPAIDAATVLDTSSPSAMLAWLDSKEGIEELSRWSVKYVILPYDSQGEIFLDDRTYSERERNVYKTALDANPDLIKKIIPGISPKMSVYETISHTDHIWLEGGNNATLSWRMTNPTSYAVTIQDMETPAKLIFSESYDPYWQLDIDGKTIRSQQTNDSLNSFSLPALRSARGTLEYLPQRYVWIGLVISVLTLIGAGIATYIIK